MYGIGFVVCPIEVAGEGEVVRVEREESAKEFLIALKCTLLVAEIEDYVPGTAS